MVWIFDREGQTLTLESRYDEPAGEFTVFIRHSEGWVQVERFEEPLHFRMWLERFQRDVQRLGWTPRHGPLIFTHGDEV
jgi:hypothetical protein